MLSLPSSVRIYVAADPVDLRKGFDRLASLARSVVKHDPMSGHVFVFYNRRRNRLKAIWWDRSGFVQLYKRLERGTFPIPSPSSPFAGHVEVDPGQLSLLLEGIETTTARRSRWWYRSPHNSVAATPEV